MNVVPAFTNDEAAWLDLAAVPPSLLEALGNDLPLQGVVSCSLWRGGGPGCSVSSCSQQNGQTSLHPDQQGEVDGGLESLSCLLRLIPDATIDDEGGDHYPIVKVHPLVLECCSPSTCEEQMTADRSHGFSDGIASTYDQDPSSSSTRIRLQSLSLPFAPSARGFPHATNEPWAWELRKVNTQGELSNGSVVDIEIVYMDSDIETAYLNASSRRIENAIEEALQGRWIMKGTLHVLSVRGACAVVIIRNVRGGTAANDETSSLQGAFSVGRVGTFHAVLSPRLGAGQNDRGKERESNRGLGKSPPRCPGYESVVEEVRDLIVLQGAPAPSGVLLMGCKGVGKTRIANCVAREIGYAKRWVVDFVSLNDVLRKASWASEDELMTQLLPTFGGVKKEKTRYLVVVDNIDLLSLPDSDIGSPLDPERRHVLNSLIQAIDMLVEAGQRVLGVSQDGVAGSLLPPELLKATRFEKMVSVEPPTQHQRERILSHLLTGLGVDNESLRQSWAELVASLTPGCVASDLHRLCTDARARNAARCYEDDIHMCYDELSNAASVSWEDLCGASRDCIPSQLAMLDVRKPTRLPYEEYLSSSDRWHRVHQASWSSFAGYEGIIRRIYRSVVVPWRLHLKALKTNSTSLVEFHELPPSGVLFHGAPGTGKTFAAACLGSSLELPMIQVRSSDVLDKYLGGSEAVVRSLFARARAASPAILLFDEFDSIASNRADDETGASVVSRILSTLLNEMDGVSSRARHAVLVVACTNRLDALDAALLRKGRLEEHVEFPTPTIDDADSILRFCLRKAAIDTSVDLHTFAMRLESKKATAAVIEGFAREAVLAALRRAQSTSEELLVQCRDLEDAIRNL